jgi:nucleotide-binding universal stress UspA family protein
MENRPAPHARLVTFPFLRNPGAWFANSRAMLEPRFRGLEQSLWGTPTRESVHAKSTQPNGSMDPGHAPHSHFRDKAGETNPGVIVVPLDFSPASLDAVRVGASVARHTQPTLVLCHAIFPKVIRFGLASPPWVTEALRGEALKEMKPAMSLAKQAGVAATCVVEEGTPAGAILKVARRYEADLIILAPREHGAWARLFFGPTTAETVTREAESHVMVLREAP